MGEEKVKDLLMKIRNGDDVAFEALAKMYNPLLISVASSFEATARSSGIHGEFADLSQELSLALYRAAKTFNVDQDKVTFGNYAKRCLNNCAVSYLRKLRSAARREQKIRNTLKKEHESETLKTDFSGKDIKTVLDAAGSVLSNYEFSIFVKYMGGTPVRDIAAQTGRTAKSVSNALFRCRTKIKKHFSEQQ